VNVVDRCEESVSKEDNNSFRFLDARVFDLLIGECHRIRKYEGRSVTYFIAGNTSQLHDRTIIKKMVRRVELENLFLADIIVTVQVKHSQFKRGRNEAPSKRKTDLQRYLVFEK